VKFLPQQSWFAEAIWKKKNNNNKNVEATTTFLRVLEKRRKGEAD